MAAPHSLRSKMGNLDMKVDRMGGKKWKPYLFKVSAQTYLLYFKVDKPAKPEGQLLLASITKVDSNPVKGAQFPFEVHFKGKVVAGSSSPWVMNASSSEERIEWMEAIKPGSSSFLKKRANIFSGQQSVLPQTLPPPPAYCPPELENSPICPPRSAQRSPMHSQHAIVGPQQQQALFGSFPSNMDPSHSWPGHTNTPSSHLGSHRQISSPQNYVEPEMSIHMPYSTTPTFTNQTSPNTNGQPPIPPRSRNTINCAERKPPPIMNLQRSSTERRSQNESPPNRHLTPPRFENGNNSYIEMVSPTHVNAPSSLKPQKPVAKPRRKLPGRQQQGEDSHYLPIVSETDSGPPKPAPRPRVRPDMASLEELARNFPPDQLTMMISMLQQVAMAQVPEQSEQDMESAWKVPETFDPVYESSAEKDSSNLKGNFKRLVSYTPMLPTERILITDEDDDEEYTPRPDWAKAIGKSTSLSPTSKEAPDQLDTLTSLQQEALFIQRSSIDDLEAIGEGQFGKVFKGSMKKGIEDVPVAIKITKKTSSEKDKEAFMWEMNVMSQMMHPNIVRLFGLVQDDVVTPWIVLEYLPHGDLKDFLIKNVRPIQKLVKYMIDVSMGMHYLSERGLVHRDLAARNVLVGNDEICKVADFGLLRELPQDESIYQMHTNVPCPVRWMAPESISERQFSVGSDVWSYGILMWEMFHPDKTPYEGLGNLEVVTKVAHGHRLAVPVDVPSIIARIMKSCWSQNREKRPSFLLISTLLTTKVTL